MVSRVLVLLSRKLHVIIVLKCASLNLKHTNIKLNEKNTKPEYLSAKVQKWLYCKRKSLFAGIFVNLSTTT